HLPPQGHRLSSTIHRPYGSWHHFDVAKALPHRQSQTRFLHRGPELAIFARPKEQGFGRGPANHLPTCDIPPRLLQRSSPSIPSWPDLLGKLSMSPAVLKGYDFRPHSVATNSWLTWGIITPPA